MCTCPEAPDCFKLTCMLFVKCSLVSMSLFCIFRVLLVLSRVVSNRLHVKSPFCAACHDANCSVLPPVQEAQTHNQFSSSPCSVAALLALHLCWLFLCHFLLAIPSHEDAVILTFDGVGHPSSDQRRHRMLTFPTSSVQCPTPAGAIGPQNIVILASLFF